MKQSIYLDFAAATPLDQAVFSAMEPYLRDQFYNPSALYMKARSVRQAVSEARASIARSLGVRPGEVVFTAGGTEANNLAIQGVMRAFPNAKIAVSAIEHESVLEPAHQFAYTVIPVDQKGYVNPDTLEKFIDHDTVLVSIMYANNEIGTIQNISKLANTIDKLRKRRKKSGNELPLYMHTDACQAAQYLPMQLPRLGVDLATINGGKLYGPKQSGVLYVKAGTKLEPIIRGGGQELGLRSGTENVAATIGLAKALEISDAKKTDEVKRLQELQTVFFELLQERFPSVIVNGPQRNRLPNNVHVTFTGADNERVIMMLDEAGIQAAAGSACSASNEEPSHVLRAIACSEEHAQASLRFTMGRTTTEKDVRTAVDTLAKIVV